MDQMEEPKVTETANGASPDNWRSTAADRPILLLATGQRCGSTFLQRLLSSHPDAFIWGEHDGKLGPILTAADQFAAWGATYGAAGHKEFARRGSGGFMSNITPPESDLREGIQSLVTGLFRQFPDGTPAPAGFRWGFKEVRYGADFVRQFVRYFPGARILHLTRDPIAVLRSLDWWEQTSKGYWVRDKTAAALAHWCAINESFLDAPDLTEWVLPVRYEELTGQAEETLAQICGFLDIDQAKLDHGVINDKVHGPAPGGRITRKLRDRGEVAAEFSDLLADPDLAKVADRLGYALAA
jgi:hypothetical protein